MSSPRSSSSKRNSSELDSEHAQKVPEAESGQQQVKLKDRQKFFEEAFQQDMEHYLSTSYLQIAERREPIGSMSSMEVNVDMLEQMDLMDMSDHEALDVFLNSGAEDNSVASPLLEADTESFGAEITLQVPTQAELRHKLASLSSTCTDSASQDTQEEEGEDEDERGGVRAEKEKHRADVQAGQDQSSKNCVTRDSST
ncbi:dystrobrevin binding protein 1b isoform X1 [Ictalurus punctatus]|uniref:Dystrobrevin binding protein 1b isoform X1 n=1 Tax=Ictalurus punctatus TaxID=7998 RepID=A0A2D0S276_ICTPU|nr:dystrobrevin binding protein 1b isoform X1 [Ictalurus punctatus]